MKKLKVGELKAGTTVEAALYHEGGRLLFPGDQTLTLSQIHALRRAGIEQVYVCEDESEVETLLAARGVSPLPLSELPVNRSLSRSLYDGQGRILLQRGTVVTAAHIEILQRRGLDNVFVEAEKLAREVERFDGFLSQEKVKHLEAHLEDRPYLLRVASAEDGRESREEPEYSAQEKRSVLESRKEGIDRAEWLVHQVATGRKVGKEVPQELAERILDHLHRHPNLVLGLAYLRERDEHLAEHAWNVAVLAAGVAVSLGYDEASVRRLAIAGLVNDLGMLRIPRVIWQKPGRLTAEECEIVHGHPRLALELLPFLGSFEDEVALTVYQHHERLDGSGYPGRRIGRHIHDCAKIAMIADVFVAVSAPRPWRPAQLPYAAMETVVRLAGQGLLDRRMVRALLDFVSLYPVGSWVQLASGEFGRVIAAGGRSFDRPVLRLLLSASGERLAEPRRVALADAPGLKVIQAVAADGLEREPTDGF